MSFRMIHENYNVSDLDRSIKFYNDALELHEVRRKPPTILLSFI
jgi:lactoylglutathione lyase